MTLPPFETGFLPEPDGAVKPYVRIGNGPHTMVVVPGAADGLLTCVDISVYLAWFYRLRATKYQLLILSRRDPISEQPGVARHADDMIRTVEELRFGPAVWECLSAAGPIGQQVAVKRPDLVTGLILSSTFDQVSNPTKRALNQWMTIAQQAGPELLWSTLEPKYRPPPDVLLQVDASLLPRTTALRDPLRLKTILSELFELDQRELVPRINCPTLVIGGANDRVVPPEVQRAMAERIPGSALELCPGYGHFNDMENPAYERHVERHLDLVSRTGRGQSS